jgi:ABC-type uncharacterized transport system permease subunit
MEMFTQIPRDLIDIVTALLIFFVAVEVTVPKVWKYWRGGNKTQMAASGSER